MSRTYMFTADDGTPLPSSLKAVAGNFVINSNKLFATTAASEYIFTTRYGNQVGLELSDGTNSVIFNGEGLLDGNGGIIFRYMSSTDFWRAVVSTAAEELQLIKREAGADTVVDAYAIPTYDNSADYIISVQPFGDTINVLLNGNLRITHNSTLFETAIGAGGYLSEQGISLDTLTVATPINSAPEVVVTPDQTGITAGAQVVLDASGSSDIDGDPLTFLWTQISGPSVTILNPAQAVVSINAPSLLEPSVSVFRVAVSDGEYEVTADVTVSVNAFVPPVSNNVDYLQQVIITETVEDKLKRIGQTQLITPATPFGHAEIITVSYPTEDYRAAELYESTGQSPDDINGLGRIYVNTDETEA